MSDKDHKSLHSLAADIKSWGREFGFQQLAIADIHLDDAAARLAQWLSQGYQGDMAWLESHGDKRWRPDKLVPETRRVIVARLDYLPADTDMVRVLRDPDTAYISRYALGRDYHKLIRSRLARLADRIAAAAPGTVIQRPFVDSAPVLEKPLAEKAGLGWMGKNTLILNSEAGSWFFLGEIYTSLPLPVDVPEQPNRCGNCTACLGICPTNAFPQPYVLDARRCISYLTIEHKGIIAEELRPLMGNRVFGCDDCQAICPWNRFARATTEDDFKPRHGLADTDLATLFQWTETEFEEKTAGSPIRRIGHERWRRNLAVGLGNARDAARALAALDAQRDNSTALVREHIEWARHRLHSADREEKPVKLFPRLGKIPARE
ncbi:MAG: tRNA epoxyqueuosine(34) reductase QueG [Porticoccaceae bacterium]